ncbi:MAG TPA: macrolide family glycosyltransferase [Pseudonocardiaceae bacterium]|nr:macrolide family glycosyltransferase [Pseudonocardiaceae bacterium]
MGSSRRHVAFFSFAGYGHVKPSLPLVAELVRRGHRVTYVVADAYARAAEPTGATLLRYHSTFPARTQAVRTAADATGMIIDLVAEGFAPLDTAATHFADDRPDLLVHDTINPYTARVLAKHWDLPIARMYPVFAYNEDNVLPGGPTNDPHHPAMAGVDTTDPVLSARKETLEAEVSAVARKHGLAPESLADAFAEGDEVLSVLFIPRAFQYGGDGFGERYSFIGPCIDDDAPPDAWTPPTDGLPIVLITASTATEGIRAYFRTCVAAFDGRPWRVVLTLGRDMRPDQLGPLPPNVEAHSWLPHAAVLPQASALVSGAGMNGLMESFHFGLPVVAIPLSEEQEANAKRVVDLRLGQLLVPTELTPDALYQAVTDIANDPAIQVGVREMRQHIQNAGGATKGADDIEGVLLGQR